jgi:GNAT superfamily N-acetyltransferase
MSETIENLTGERVGWITREQTKAGWNKPDWYFRDCWGAQQRGALLFLVSRNDEELLGWAKVVWRSDYAPLRDGGIPEIQDLNVLPAHRRKGVATRLLDHAETAIKDRCATAGIAVGLHESYGAAQRLYALRGYVPDGRGVTYHNEIVEEGQKVGVDDDLVLHLTKSLGKQSAN